MIVFQASSSSTYFRHIFSNKIRSTKLFEPTPSVIYLRPVQGHRTLFHSIYSTAGKGRLKTAPTIYVAKCRQRAVLVSAKSKRSKQTLSEQFPAKDPIARLTDVLAAPLKDWSRLATSTLAAAQFAEKQRQRRQQPLIPVPQTMEIVNLLSRHIISRSDRHLGAALARLSSGDRELLTQGLLLQLAATVRYGAGLKSRAAGKAGSKQGLRTVSQEGMSRNGSNSSSPTSKVSGRLSGAELARCLLILMRLGHWDIEVAAEAMQGIWAPVPQDPPVPNAMQVVWTPGPQGALDPSATQGICASGPQKAPSHSAIQEVQAPGSQGTLNLNAIQRVRAPGPQGTPVPKSMQEVGASGPQSSPAPTAVCALLGALAGVEERQRPQGWRDWVVGAVGALTTRIGRTSVLEVVDIVDSLDRLSVRPSDQWLRSAAGGLVQQLSDARPSELASISRCLSMIAVPKPPATWATALHVAAALHIDVLSGSQLVAVLSGLAASLSPQRKRADLALFIQECIQRLSPMLATLPPAQLLEALQAVTTLQATPPPSWCANAATAILHASATLSSDQRYDALMTLEKLGYKPSKITLARLQSDLGKDESSQGFRGREGGAAKQQVLLASL